MERARTLEAVVATDESPLAHARLHRQLTIDEAARRASVAAGGDAVARGRPPLPLPDPRPRARSSRSSTRPRSRSTIARRSSSPACRRRRCRASPWRRLAAVAAFAARRRSRPSSRSCSRAKRLEAEAVGSRRRTRATLPAPWAIKVVVLNGSGDIVYTRSVASRVQALSYRVTHVGTRRELQLPADGRLLPAGRRGRRHCGSRKQLDVPVQPLPGGTDPRRSSSSSGPSAGPELTSSAGSAGPRASPSARAASAPSTAWRT